MKLIKNTKIIYKPFEEQREKNPVMWLRLTGVSRPPPAEHSRYASPRRSKYVESMLYCILALESDAMHFAFGQVHMMMLSCVVALRSSVGVRFQSIYNLQSNTTWSARCSHGAKLKTHKHTHANTLIDRRHRDGSLYGEWAIGICNFIASYLVVVIWVRHVDSHNRGSSQQVDYMVLRCLWRSIPMSLCAQLQTTRQYPCNCANRADRMASWMTRRRKIVRGAQCDLMQESSIRRRWSEGRCHTASHYATYTIYTRSV